MTQNSDIPDAQRLRRSFLLAIAVAALVGVFTLSWYAIVGVDKSKDGPRVTVGKYMKAMRDKDVKTAQDLLCSGLQDDKQDIADRAQRFRRLDYRIGDSDRKSDSEYRVDVAVNSVVDLNGTDTPSNTTYVFKVVKERGDWLVCGITT